MSQEPTLRYFGWSSFAFESGGGTVLFDPLYRKMFGKSWSSLDDFRSAKVICVSHGHADHYVDVAAVQKQTDAVVVSSHEVCEHLRAKYKVRSQKLIAAEPLQEIDVCGFRITPFVWGHKEVKDELFLLMLARRSVLRGAFLSMIKLFWMTLTKAPFNAPFYAFHVVDPSGLRLTNYCEGFSDTTNMEEVRQVARRLTTDVMIAGGQLNFEEYVAKGVAAMSPRSVFLFNPHEVILDRLGVKSTPAETFASAIKRELPQAEVIVAKPMSSYTMCARS